MKKEIRDFEVAAKQFKAATSALNRVVEVEVQRRNTIDELQELLSTLPVSYIGCRRIYNKIDNLLNIEDNETKIQEN